jgi:hypothetical protein
MINDQTKPTYTKPNSWDKLNKAQILEAMQNGAILRKHYGVYIHWDLQFEDGSRHWNMRKNAYNRLNSVNYKNIVCIDRDKSGYSYKWDHSIK